MYCIVGKQENFRGDLLAALGIKEEQIIAPIFGLGDTIDTDSSYPSGTIDEELSFYQWIEKYGCTFCGSHSPGCCDGCA